MELGEIWKHLSSFPLAHVATIDADHPRVRPMCLIAHNNTLWAATTSMWNKIKQIQENNKIEFTVLYKSEERVGCIRATGRATIIEDLETKKMLSLVIPFFNDYWNSPEDPAYTLLRFDLDVMRVDHTDGKKYTIETNK